jgi:hypothetical protein
VKQTRGSETSQYPQEKKSTEIPAVAASEPGIAQTVTACSRGVVGLSQGIARRVIKQTHSRRILERTTVGGDSPVSEMLSVSLERVPE